jgi:hypothetical protein
MDRSNEGKLVRTLAQDVLGKSGPGPAYTLNGGSSVDEKRFEMLMAGILWPSGRVHHGLAVERPN